MINNLLTRVFGSRNERLLKQLHRTVDKINALEAELQQLTDEQLKAKTPEFQQRIAGGEALDKILPEAFAVCREASRRVLGMRHYDVQLIGGMVLHLGKIAEMRTGEGKTLVATLPAYLNALSGKGLHIVTVNDYLARRDSEWMGKLYNFLGLKVGVVVPQQCDTEKRAADLKHEHGVGYCNITKCCTKVCPEGITITDNAIIPLKERVIDQLYDPVAKLFRMLRPPSPKASVGKPAR